MTLEDEVTEIKKKLVEIERRIKNLESSGKTIKTKGEKKKVSISDRLAHLKMQGFFDKPKLANEIVKKLATEGYHYRPSSLTWSLQKAVREKELGRNKKENKWVYYKR